MTRPPLGRLLLRLLLLLAVPSCHDGGTALSVKLRLEGPAGCVRLTATGTGGQPLRVDVPAEDTTERDLVVAVYPGGALGTGAVSLWAQGFPGACGSDPATQEARGETAFTRGEVQAVLLQLRLLDPDSDGDGFPDSQDCAPRDASRHPGTGNELDAACGNGADDDCDGEVDDGCPCPAGASEPCHPLGLDWPGLGKGSCKAGLSRCQPDGGWGTCTGAISPAPESCNGLDDDCDGTEDEDAADAGQPCASGWKGACAAGAWLCSDGGLVCAPSVAPSAELCNGLDDDCDGQPDEDFPGVGQSCKPGVGACAREGIRQCQPDGSVACSVDAGLPSPEVCNGEDDDCDGQPDEDFPGLGQPCSNGLLGACARTGTVSCLADGGAGCSAPAVSPGTEACNTLDDDCDGQSDEGLGLGQACTNGQVGACLRSGTRVCKLDGTAGCSAATVTPGTESCNGVDDDCDGTADDGFNVGQPCTVGVGACARAGTWTCNAQGTAGCTDGGLAVAAGSPSREVCDGVDNDCDGTADEHPGCGGPRTDVAEDAATTWAAGESLDDNPSPCGTRPSSTAPGPTTFYVAVDTSSIVAGANSARTDYLYPGAAYVVGFYPGARSGAWDLRYTTGLTFQYRVSLPTGITVQAAPTSPYVVLCSAGGGHASYAPSASLANTDWLPVSIPLAGGSGWVRTATANFDPSNVHSVEFQLDPTRGGRAGTVQMFLDDVRFY